MAIFLSILLLTVYSEQDFSSLLRAGDENYQNHNYKDAEESYLKALSIEPRRFEALIGLARSRISSGNTQGAFPLLDDALVQRPADRGARRLFAEALVGMNVFGRAEPILRELVQTDPADRESFFYLGVLMYQSGYYGAALADFDKSLPDDDADSLRKTKTDVYRAVCLSKVGRTDEAEAAFGKLALQPNARKEPDLLLVYAELLYETGRPELALKQADQAIAESTSMAIAHFWRAKILFHLNRLPEAAAAAERSIQLIPQLPYAHNLLVRIYQSQGKSVEAQREADWLREFERRFAAGPGGR